MIYCKIINKSNNPLPSYATNLSAAVDLMAFTDHCIHIAAGSTAIIPTGLYLEIPAGFEGQVRSRSGLASKGIVVANSPGTIDADYRGEIKVILQNLSNQPYYVENGDRIAQFLIKIVDKISWIPSKELSKTERNSGGFGSTGL